MSKFWSILLITATLIVSTVSCTSSREAMKMQRSLVGRWHLESIAVNGITGKYKALLLNEANLDCFIGSMWTLEKRNIGHYYLADNSTNCQKVTRNIYWTITNGGDGSPAYFEFKRQDDKGNDMDGANAGFKFKIVSNTADALVLREDLTVNGVAVQFIYSFKRK